MRIASIHYDNFAHLDKFYDREGVIIKNPDDLKKGDIVIAHGGGDISPSFYDKDSSHTPSDIDLLESACLDRAIEMRLPIYGICKGAQWLCVKAGGVLFDRVVGHEHQDHLINLTTDNALVWSNSSHQQMMNPYPIPIMSFDVLGVAVGVDSKKYMKGIEQHVRDYEIIYFHKIRGFAVQGHPEWANYNSKFNQYCMNKSKAVWDEKVRD